MRNRGAAVAVAAWCGCTIGGLHVHGCGLVGHVDGPSARAVTSTREQIKAVLVGEQTHRGDRQAYVTDPDLGDGAEWNHAEVRAMTDAANVIRAEHGLPAVTVFDVVRVEQSAVGHSDYTSKFALYVADLAVGRDHRL